MNAIPVPSGRTEKRVMLVAAVVLLLAFFSTSFTGFYNVGKSGGGVLDCVTLERVKAFEGQNKMLNYDYNNNGVIDKEDIDYVAEQAKNRPCTLPSECAVEGQTRCSVDERTVDLCVRDEFGRLVIEKVPCEAGQRCMQRGDRLGERYAACAYPFR